MIDLIPIAQLARFGGAGRTAAVWWSDVDESIVGLFADLDIAIERRWRHVLHQLIACRPRLCPLRGPCRCDRPCTSTLAEILEAHSPNRGTDVAVHIAHGWPTHPGPDALADLMDRWAVEIFGWEIIR